MNSNFLEKKRDPRAHVAKSESMYLKMLCFEAAPRLNYFYVWKERGVATWNWENYLRKKNGKMIFPPSFLSQWREMAMGANKFFVPGFCWSSSLGDTTNSHPTPSTYPDYLSPTLLRGLLGQIMEMQ